MKKIYMYIDTSDEFLLPLAIAESPTELARIAGTNKTNVLTTIYHGERYREKENKIKSGKPSRGWQFEKIIMEDDEWNEAAEDLQA